ncbi:hypothetical protein HDV01_007886 [Terramyces sp. JEL0728]|nr:hypothetical protein HDV01_007886 [Terramyces sp. JEL0728]
MLVNESQEIPFPEEMSIENQLFLTADDLSEIPPIPEKKQEIEKEDYQEYKVAPLTRRYWEILQSLQQKLPFLLFIIKRLENTVPFLHESEVHLSSHSILKSIQQRTNLSPPASFLLFTIISSVGIAKLSFRNPLLTTQLYGILYPLYRSLKAVETPELNDDERWLTYWSCFGLFVLLDHQAKLISRRVPYYLPKVLILYWLQRDGSLFVYRRREKLKSFMEKISLEFDLIAKHLPYEPYHEFSMAINTNSLAKIPKLTFQAYRESEYQANPSSYQLDLALLTLESLYYLIEKGHYSQLDLALQKLTKSDILDLLETMPVFDEHVILQLVNMAGLPQVRNKQELFQAAILNNSIKLVQILNQEITLQDLILSIKYRNIQIFDYMLSKSEPNIELLLHATDLNQPAIVERLLPLVDPTFDSGLSLRIACKKGYLDIVKLLVKDQRVDIHSQSNYSLCWAARKGHFEIVKLLVENGADPSDNDNFAIKHSCRNGHYEIVKLLLQDSRVDKHAENDYCTAWAHEKGFEEIIQLLM